MTKVGRSEHPPAQAKTGLEWATRRVDSLTAIGSNESSVEMGKP
jgi:hypothetical protein